MIAESVDKRRSRAVVAVPHELFLKRYPCALVAPVRSHDKV